ncbi:hypothetical protein BGY98DRAFT_590925 [Russula aff. rugulosa BPL654]|nr:hypothetical protein BGY98DRAFT_590925 [Russula aff. rugulosa BPL654]
MIAARSSYLAWVSRGSWPKRLKANGAAVEVGIGRRRRRMSLRVRTTFMRLFCCCGVGAGECVGGKKCFLGEGHHHPYGAYICAVRLDGGDEIAYDGLQRIGKPLCSISGIVPLTYTITCYGAFFLFEQLWPVITWVLHRIRRPACLQYKRTRAFLVVPDSFFFFTKPPLCRRVHRDVVIPTVAEVM